MVFITDSHWVNFVILLNHALSIGYIFHLSTFADD